MLVQSNGRTDGIVFFELAFDHVKGANIDGAAQNHGSNSKVAVLAAGMHV